MQFVAYSAFGSNIGLNFQIRSCESVDEELRTMYQSADLNNDGKVDEYEYKLMKEDNNCCIKKGK